MLRPRVWIPILVALAVGLLLLDQRPLRLPTHGPRVEASRSWRDDGHGTLLVLADEVAEPADATASIADPAGEWENLLRQVFGGVDVLPASRLLDGDRARLEARSLLVLPRQTLRALPLNARDRIDRQVENGGLAVLTEAPDSAWAAHLGLRIAAVEWRDPLPWPLEPALPNVQRPQLVPPPAALTFRWTVWRYAPDPRARPRTLSTARIAGRPVAWYRPVGDGGWSILALDFGRLAHRLRQGGGDRPPDGAPHPAHLDGRRQTNDLVLAPDLLDRDEPWLDAWVAALLDPVVAASPWPRLSTAPFAHDGWLLLGQEGGPPAKGIAVTHYLGAETAIAPSSLAEAELGLLTAWPSETSWRQFPGLRKLLGVGPLRPLGRVLDPSEQRHRLETTLSPGRPLALNHNRQSLWSESPELAFEALTAAEMRADTSFGPAGAGAGWAFGSAQPFRPLDPTGRTFGLWELPYLFSGPGSNLDLGRLDLWLRRNRHGGRGPVQLQITGLSDAPSVTAALAERARAENHRIARLSELLDWWEERDRTRLHWNWEEPTLTVRVEGAPTEAGDRLAVLLPRTWHDRALATWRSNPPATASRRVWAFDEALLAIEVPAAETTLRVRYLRTP